MVVFVFLIPFLLILLSYKLVLGFSDYDLGQQKVFDFLGGEELEVEMTSEEVAHLEDVRDLMGKADFVFYFLLLACTLIFAYGFKDKKYLKRLFLYGGLTSFGLIVLFLFFVLIEFDFAFEFFHKVFFPGGNWVFSGDSYLIQTFPIQFFVSVVKRIIFLSLFLASLFIGGGIYLEYVKKV